MRIKVLAFFIIFEDKITGGYSPHPRADEKLFILNVSFFILTNTCAFCMTADDILR